MTADATEGAVASEASRARRLLAAVWRWGKRGVTTLVSLLVGYLAIVLLGLFPVNQDFQPATDGVEVFIYSGEFHSDLILPLINGIHDWRSEFPASHFEFDTSYATHVAIGWGERNFYLHTPTWSDLKISTATKALLIPPETVMHVGMSIEPTTGGNIRSVRISDRQYLQIVSHIRDSFVRDATGNVRLIPDETYSGVDAFYDGQGSYHAFRTCNCWAGEAMRAGGIKTGWFTPLPKSVFLYLPEK